MRILIILSLSFLTEWTNEKLWLCEKLNRKLGNKTNELKTLNNCINAEIVTRIEQVNFKN